MNENTERLAKGKLEIQNIAYGCLLFPIALPVLTKLIFMCFLPKP